MAIILFSRPDHDQIITYLYMYSRKLVEYAKQKSHNVLNEEKINANKNRITGVIKKKKPDLIMFNGHGDEKTICGHNNQPLIELGKNHYLLKSAIVYCLSCKSALELGKKSVEDGTTTFIGYEDDFALGRDTRYDSTPSKDKIGNLFLGPSNLLMESLIKGNVTGEAVEKCKNRMKEDISRLRTSSEQNEQDALPYLYSNYACLAIHGDNSASIR